jgi:hypothetical protein
MLSFWRITGIIKGLENRGGQNGKWTETTRYSVTSLSWLKRDQLISCLAI